MDLSGKPCIDLAEKCPDGHVAFPRTPCQNMGCERRIKDPSFLNCSIAAGVAGPHEFADIGRMMGTSAQAAQQTLKRALKKLGGVEAIREILPTKGPRVVHLQLLRSAHRASDGRPAADGEEPVDKGEAAGLQALGR